MAISFEELADAGVPDLKKMPKPAARSRSYLLVLFAVLAVAAISYGSYRYFIGPTLPTAAEILLSVDGDVPGVLPHKLDSSTEFEESLDYLKAGQSGPDLRKTREAQQSVGLIAVKATAPKGIEMSSAPAPTTPVAVATVATKPLAENLVVSSNKTVVVPRPSVMAGEVLPTQAAAPVAVSMQQLPVVELGERDWGGLVLVPDSAKLAKAYTSDVKMARVEAHPIDGERIRVWARIQNLTEDDLSAEVGCEFRSSRHSVGGRTHFEPTMIPSGSIVDVYFESPLDRVESYTVMVKRGSGRSSLASR